MDASTFELTTDRRAVADPVHAPLIEAQGSRDASAMAVAFPH
jgi:hypothetical protein